MPESIVLGLGAYYEGGARQIHSLPPVHRLVPVPAFPSNHDLYLRRRMCPDVANLDANQCRRWWYRQRIGPCLDWQCRGNKIPLRSCHRCLGVLHLRYVHDSKGKIVADWTSPSVEFIEAQCQSAVITYSLIPISADGCTR